jgi:3-hydroxyisobutyrate dehydrogenase-like beta-hydroxyacid dehydrogenase
MRKKMEENGAEPCSLAEVMAASNYILSVVTPQACSDIAQCLSYSNNACQIFVDLNSTSPAMKRTIGRTVTSKGLQFVEGVIPGAVSEFTSPVILLGGPAAEATASVFQRYGLAAQFYSLEVGRASTFKMLRSIFSKGMEAVLVETLVAAHRTGLLDAIWHEIGSTLAAGKAEEAFQTWIRSHLRSAERRYYEMQEVSEFLHDIGIRPVIPRACGEVFARSLKVPVDNAVPREPSLIEVIEYLDRAELAG